MGRKMVGCDLVSGASIVGGRHIPVQNVPFCKPASVGGVDPFSRTSPFVKVFRNELPESEAARQQLLFQQRKTKGLYFVPEIGRAELMADFRRLAAHTPRLGCRTMDILHVACACQLKPDQFLSFDTRQIELAKIAGLAVLKFRQR